MSAFPLVRNVRHLLIYSIVLLASFSWGHAQEVEEKDPWIGWHRPADNPVFNTTMGNNHDCVLFVEPELAYPYHLIVSHTPKAAHLWRAKTFSWSSEDWELVSDDYQIGGFYEYDDGVKVGDTYFIYENGKVFTFDGPLEEASGKWKLAGTFPHKQCDDIGIFYENGVFHMFGEHGHFPHGPDGTSLAHFTSKTGLGDWTLVNAKAVDPNPDGGHKYGVGDATIAKIDGTYYLFCDRESKGSPYKVVGWRTKDLNKPFESIGKALIPRSDEVDDWDNYRIQDADIAYIPEQNRFVMMCNMKDHDGNPGGNFPTLKEKQSRVIGTFYSDALYKPPTPGEMIKVRAQATDAAPRLPYWLYLPENYGTTQEPLPVLVFLHGMGERGDTLDPVTIHGPPKLIRAGESMPFIMIAPQCPNDGPFHKWARPGQKTGTQFWPNPETAQKVQNIIDFEKKRLGRIDSKRVYLTGLSMGGMGTYTLATMHPKTFAACAPICGLYTGDVEVGAAKMKDIPVWAFHGDRDRVVSLADHQKMTDALKASGGDVKLTVYPGVGHDSWTRTYKNPELYAWFLQHEKNGKSEE